jgi:hypothetical protein
MGRGNSNSIYSVVTVSFLAGASIPLMFLLMERRRWKKYRQNGNIRILVFYVAAIESANLPGPYLLTS